MQTAQKLREVSDYDIELDIPTRNRERLRVMQETEKPPRREIKAEPKQSFKQKYRLLFVGILSFAMFMTLIYRYNLINVKNLENINYQKEYTKIKAQVSLAQIDLERRVSFSTIEDYAKQKLGMQKPTKSQIIYIDTRKTDNNVQKK